MNKNTFASEDSQIQRANGAVDNLCAIIERLDSLLTEWQQASGCDWPEELRGKLEELEKP